MKPNNVIKNIIGKGKKVGGKHDMDGDGVVNRKDCQPKNTMRQDYKMAGDRLYMMKQRLRNV